MNSKFLAAAFCWALAASASAQVTTGVLTGVVTSVNDPSTLAPSGIHLGDAVSATFTYGAVASTGNPDASSRNFSFNSGAFSYVVTIGSYTWNYTTGSGSVSLQNDHSVLNRDQYYVSTPNISGTPVSFPGAIETSYLALGIYDWTSPYDLISGLTLPRATGDLNLAAANQTQGVISSFGSGGPTNNWTINYSAASLSLTAVPEPSTIGLLIGMVSFIAAGVIRSRNGRTQKLISPCLTRP